MKKIVCREKYQDVSHDMLWRSRFPVLVPEAEAVGMIGVIRSLGRAGYPVHACSSLSGALGLRSNLAAFKVVCPPYDDPGFIDWARHYVASHGICAIVPSEGFLFAVAQDYTEFQALMPIPEDRNTTFRLFSKIDVMRNLLSAPPNMNIHQHLPPSIIVYANGPLPSVSEIETIGGPFFLKSDRAYCRNRSHHAFTKRVESAEEARSEIEDSLKQYDAVLLQGWVGGQKAAAAFCLADGRVLAETGVLGLHTNPHTGGMMSLRETWYHPNLSASALALLKYLQWQGVAMVECKWDPGTDRFWLIEINSRYWGYLHLDLYSGVDVPRIQVDHFFGRSIEAVPRQKLKVRCRHTIPGDIGYLLSKLKDRRVGKLEKIASALRFAFNFFDYKMHSDLLFPGDRKLYWLQWYQYVSQLLKRQDT